MVPSLDVRVLGPLEVQADGRPMSIAGAKPRAILTLLGLYGGRTVTAELIGDLLWGDDPPRTYAQALQTHISKLRHTLGRESVLTTGDGWRLAAGTTDVARFDAWAAAGREALRNGQADLAVVEFDRAVDAWRGLPDLPTTPRGAAEVARWVEAHASLEEDRADALLDCGRASELVGHLEHAVGKEPMRERRWQQLMLALYRSGRQADALAAYRRIRSLLDDELGVEPGPELRKLESAILNHDPGLTASRVESPAAAPTAPGLRPLPAQRTSFVGREPELDRIEASLRSAPLVTIAGPGGVGKTRLALAAAERTAALFADGVAFVDLVPARPKFVIQPVAAALGVVERPQQPLAEAVYERLASGRLLLVLDNCEHVLDEVSELVDGLLARCPGVTVLATSRERLGALGEHVETAPPLSVSGGAENPAASEAVQLFLDRAAATGATDLDPAQVSQVCVALDGVPLAIELAAARCASLGLDGVRAGLGDRMRLLMGARGARERHRSLRAVLDWSNGLLDKEEQTAFRRLAVFAGGFDLDAAAAVIGHEADGEMSRAVVADLIGRLGDKHLVWRQLGRSGSSWRLLQIVRDYATELLANSGESEQVAARHLRWAAEAAERMETRMEAGAEWQEAFDTIADDLRAALSAATADQAARHRLGRALAHLAYGRGFLAEARQHYLAAAGSASAEQAVSALQAAAGVAYAEMRHDVAYEICLRAAGLAAQTGDGPAEATALASAVVLGKRCPGGFPHPPTDEQLARHLARAESAGSGGSPAVQARVAAARAWSASPVRARCDGPLGEEALAAAHRASDPVLVCAALDGMTTVALGEGRFKSAARLAAERLKVLDRVPRHDPSAGGEVVDTFHMVTETALASGDLPGALAAARRARGDALGSGVPILAASRMVLPLALRGDFVQARAEAERMRDAWERSGRPTAGWMAPAAFATAMLSGLTGDRAGFQSWSQLGRQLTKTPRAQGIAPFVECRIALHENRITDALVIAESLPAEYLGKFDAYARATAAEAAVIAQRPDAEARLAAADGLAQENDWVAACLRRAEGRLRGDRAALEDAVAQWERIEARYERACTLVLLDDRAAEGAQELRKMGCTVRA